MDRQSDRQRQRQRQRQKKAAQRDKGKDIEWPTCALEYHECNLISWNLIEGRGISQNVIEHHGIYVDISNITHRKCDCVGCHGMERNNHGLLQNIMSIIEYNVTYSGA